ncbi:MAG: putative NAD(P)/FAD-binding protein YdhS [Tardiphaga sp.]|nr:putative NAD(P)/FAD-binding protein YdhS [Tardiphaga sp.]
MTSEHRAPLRVAIIGGGAAGTLAALILAKTPGIGRITLLDRDGRFGRGLAYSAPEKWHRINVPAYKMGGCGADDPEAFVDWLAGNGHVTGPDYSTSFVPRWLYGDFLCAQLAELTASGQVEARHDAALSVAPNGGGYRVVTASGDAIEADLVFVCIGNHPPSGFGPVEPSPRSISDVWAANALDPIAADDSVLVIGTGATAVDVVIDLVHRGVRREITMVSRRGLLPRVDIVAVADPDPVQTWPVPTVRGLFHALREDIRRKAADGIPWQSVIDTFRLQTAGFWQGFSETERARFSRHLRSIWLAHRHRLAPDVAELLAQLQQKRQLRVIPARIMTAPATQWGHDVTIRARGLETIHLATNWILNCTGPEERYDRVNDPLVQSLLATGLARPGPTGLGLDVDQKCWLIDRAGKPQPGLFAIGPATRGTFWEVTAATNIRQQLLGVAEQLMADQRQSSIRPK